MEIRIKALQIGTSYSIGGVFMNKIGEFAENILFGIVEAVVEIVFDIVGDFLSGL